MRSLGSLIGLAALATVGAACEAADRDAPPQAAPPAARVAPADDVYRDRAERVVSFLRGDTALDASLLDDSVTLHVVPEGGGERVVEARETLEDRNAWRVGRHSLVPPDGLTELTTAVGVHFDCMATTLDSHYPELARRPHVGVLLEPPSRESCLQTWNVTLVFGGGGTPPRLTAVVYDQWEW